MNGDEENISESEQSETDDEEYLNEDEEYKAPSPGASPSRSHSHSRSTSFNPNLYPGTDLFHDINPTRHPRSFDHPHHAHRESQRPRLYPGEVVWWHNLKRAGDIPGVSEEYAEMYLKIKEDPMTDLRRGLKAMR